jgi:hypothetical protein
MLGVARVSVSAKIVIRDANMMLLWRQVTSRRWHVVLYSSVGKTKMTAH